MKHNSKILLNNTTLAWCNICKNEQDILQYRPEWQQHIEPFKAIRRKKEWLTVRWLLQQLMGLPTPEIRYEATGKPFLSSGVQHISITHSAKIVAIALHPTQQTGVDVEEISTRADRVKHRFLSEGELAMVANAQQQDYHFLLSLFWSTKECMYKWYGKKRLRFIEHLNINAYTIQQNKQHKKFGTLQTSISNGLFEKKLNISYQQIEQSVLTYVTA